MKLENGKTYLVNHARKGTFMLKVESQSDDWVHGVIVGGKTTAMLDYNEQGKGEPITSRIKFIRSAVEQPAA